MLYSVSTCSRIALFVLTFVLGLTATWLLQTTESIPVPAKHKETQNVVVTAMAPSHDTQPPSTEGVPDPISDVDKLNVKNPYDIRLFIDKNPKLDIQNLWQKLGIGKHAHFLPGWGSDAPFFDTCDYCKAEVYEHDLNNQIGNELILRISNDGTESCRYLVFTPERWNVYKLVGYIDHDFGRYRMPSHHFVVGGGRTFLVVQVQTVSGSGVSMYFDRMFTVEKGKLIEVLKYPAEGHESMGPPPAREFFGRVADIRANDSGLEIQIALTVRYSTWNDKNVDIEIWTKRQKAVFESSPAGKAHLDENKSNISLAELKSVYDVDTLTERDFYKYNREEIKRKGWKLKKR